MDKSVEKRLRLCSVNNACSKRDTLIEHSESDANPLALFVSMSRASAAIFRQLQQEFPSTAVVVDFLRVAVPISCLCR